MSKTKKVLLLVIGLLIVALSFTGASYAMWQINNAQDGENVVNVGCFETITDLGTNLENSAINLDKHFPISDAQGMNLTPFTFTVTNTCTSVANFQVNLETLSTSNIGKQYIKVAINNSKSILNNLDSVEKTLDNASSSNMLESGTLYPGQSITFDIRLWVDEATTKEDLGADEPGTDLIYAAKVTLSTSARMYNDTAVDTIMKLVSGSPTNTIDVIEKSAPDGATCTNTLAYDNTVDNNLRYVGANPCNYVCFNNECPTPGVKYVQRDKNSGFEYDIFDTEEECNTYLTEHNSTETDECFAYNTIIGGWRIIGLMNNVDDGTGKSESRVKLIRNDSLGEYSFDMSDVLINNGYGINQWGESGEYEGSDLMIELNTDYLNNNLTNNPMWYGYQLDYTSEHYRYGYGQNTEFDKTKALSASAQSLIGDAVWYTGVLNDSSIEYTDENASIIYNDERSNNLHAINNGKYCTLNPDCTDEITRTSQWTGKVALIYMSDYMYSTSGGTTINRNLCLTNPTNDYTYWDNNDCSNNSWINNKTDQWFLSPYGVSTHAYYNSSVLFNGLISNGFTNMNYNIRPSIYLNSSVKIISGNGTETSPYILSMD